MQKNGDLTAFNKAYASLNIAQRKAVDTIDGPVMVIAGPGTGKTQVLSLRIAQILLKTDTKPEQILALTFTESGARAMRERLLRLIGQAAYDVAIYTFHGFAEMLIRRYPEAYPRIIGGRPISDIEQIQVLESIIADPQFSSLRPSGDPMYYIRPIRSAIQTLKQEYISPDVFSEKIATEEESLSAIERFHTKGAHKGKERGEYKDAVKHIERNRELLAVYRRYEAALLERRCYDYNDMITYTVAALTENEDMLRDLQETYVYVLADEHQDVNGSQNRILELLVSFHDNPNIFVVGDEKQAIYRFQGASLDNFLYFEASFGQTTIISLTDNYRSGQEILAVAHDLIKTDDPLLRDLRIPLQAQSDTSSLVRTATFLHEAIEHAFIVDEVKQKIQAGVPPTEIAVIVRTNREVELFAELLRKAGIQVQASADGDVLEHPITKSLITLLRAVTEPYQEASIVELLHAPYVGLSLHDVALLLQARRRDKPLYRIMRDANTLETLGIEDSAAVLKIGVLIDSVANDTVTEAPHRILERLLEESGFLRHVEKSSPLEGVRVIRRLYDEIEGMVRRNEVATLRDVLRQLSLYIAYNLPLQAPFISDAGSSVQVMTAHKSKGLEFEVVLVPHLTDKMWGAKKTRDVFKLPVAIKKETEIDSLEDDERRLLYVTLTRAKRELVLTTARTALEGRELIRSRFIADIQPHLYQEEDMTAFSETFSPLSSLTPYRPSPQALELMKQMLLERGLSPTAFNNYLKDPWEFFFKNVLRIPQVKTTELQFGSAVHFVLDELCRNYIAKGETYTTTTVSELLTKGLSQEALADEEFVRLHERGLVAFSVYHDHFLSTVTKESKTEVSLRAQLETGIPEFPSLTLTGTLDRVDYKDGVVTRVVDYKTGKPKTRGYIEGTTADSTGDYKRQLTFYALLLSLQPDRQLHTRTGVISFVEPTKDGAIKEETFMISDEEIKALRTDIIQTLRALLSGQVLEESCKEDVCHFCDLVPFWLQVKTTE